MFAGPLFLEVIRRAGHYQISWNGQRPFSVPLKKGRLILQTLHETPTAGGAWVRSGLELAWEQGGCVFYTKPESLTPWVRRRLVPLTEDAYVKGVTKVADEQTRSRLQGLAIGVDQWTTKRGQGPPAPAEMHRGSAFDRWLVRLTHSVWVWPDNPFTGQSMAIGTNPGDFSYTVQGKAWTVLGHLSGGGTFDALEQ